VDFEWAILPALCSVAYRSMLPVKRFLECLLTWFSDSSAPFSAPLTCSAKRSTQNQRGDCAGKTTQHLDYPAWARHRQPCRSTYGP